MKILVYPHDLGMGGSQLNAIELAAGVRDLGHEVVVYGRPGVLCGRIQELGLEFIESPDPGRRPSPAVVRDLRRLIASRGIDVIHGYEWPPSLEARLAVLGTDAVAVSTVMSMAVAPFIPRQVPLVVGTQQIAAVERAAGRRLVTVIEPPVDVVHNVPGSPDVDVVGFLATHGIPANARRVVMVSRFAHELKLEGLLTAIATVPTMGDDVTLTVVGDGPAVDLVAAAAAAANEAAGRRAVVLTGEVSDPRAAYESADVILGMGGSALRALAFAKPLVVQGELGFWQVLTPPALEDFLWTGWYGVGDSVSDGVERLREVLAPLLMDGALRRQLGDYGRELVCRRFSVEAAASRQLTVYQAAVAGMPAHGRLSVGADGGGALRFGAHIVRRKVKRWRGNAATDDFNAAPIAAQREWGRAR